MKDVLWRIDDELLTLKGVDKECFSTIPPIGHWLPALVGSGSYAYFETLHEAKAVYLDILYEKREEIKSMINYAETIEEIE